MSTASGRELAPRRHHHREPVLGRVAIGESAHHRDIHDLGPHPRLAVVDHIGVRAAGGQHGHCRRHDRETDQGALRLRAGQHLAQRVGRLRAPLAHVEMWVGAVADEDVDAVHHQPRNIGVEIEGGGDGHVGPDHLADHREEQPVGIVLLGGEGGAVRADIDAVERQRRQEAPPHLREHLDKEAVLDRAVGLGHRGEDRHRRPGPAAVHRCDEARGLAQHARARRARLGEKRLAGEICPRDEIRLPRHGRELVALNGKTKKRNAGRAGWSHGGLWEVVPG
jgi:hypothetical protein